MPRLAGISDFWHNSVLIAGMRRLSRRRISWTIRVTAGRIACLVLEPPSAPLLALLRELRLCTPTDLRRCRGRVRRMATDLPAFDSVWIDALVQLRRLTPFQAQVLESPHPGRLRVGPCVLVERLDSNFSGTTYLARSITTRQARTLKVVTVEEDLTSEILSRSQQLSATGRKLAHPSIVIPQACEHIGEQLVFVSRHVPGRTLTELLIRRGRFPASVVWQIGRQLADGLARLHAIGLAHGEIRPSQVRLLSEGTAVLVDTGIQGVLEPELTPHSQLVPECYDCVAPELIGTGITYNPLSDLYALGCLLWQLLAGRPPFPGGDPLAKLAAHQTRRIRDVRDFAPDTPPKLAEMILQLTSPNLADRPANADAVLKVWGPPRYSGRRLLKRFVTSFERPVGDGLKLSTVANSPLVWTLTLLFAISGLTAAYVHEGTRATLLHIWASIPQANSPNSPTGPGSATDDRVPGNSTEPTVAAVPMDEHLLPLPEPDAQGIIELTSPGPFSAGSIRQIGMLTIRAREGIQAEIVLPNEPLFLLAEKVKLQRLRFRQSAPTAADVEQQSMRAQVLVEALELDVRDCTFLTQSTSSQAAVDPAGSSQGPSSVAGICWKVPDAAGTHSGAGVLENLIVLGGGPLLDLRSPAQKVVFRNVLRLGGGSLLDVLIPPADSLEMALQVEHTTCRQAGSLIRWTVLDHQPTRQQISVQARDCVFEVMPADGGLIEFVGEKHVAAWSKRIKFVGDACVASEQTEVAVRRNPLSNELLPLDSSEMELEGITQGGYSFRGAFGLVPSDSSIEENYVGVRSGEALPGIIAGQLPIPAGATSPDLTSRPRLSAAAPVTSARSAPLR